ncbi:MAG: bifunctional oligoribonuclease/PAP phosphatase NrnA [Bacteroidota bacterium]|jgi:phosphoesterase RecJ-like protein|nr:bifunctional oligoribonuclease/PAP phosphatase NrnA [Bacteroidota bacterium]MEC8701981.1 bifunctional oligoribonuclease/PAP phosphatase NrnA [Bacteroidota bacterium]|tara:strand:- start:524 stop:1516 length:993 start_codon:yes stop_codon:yes gene_type:complete
MQELKNLLSAKQNVVITTHVNPDGDAIGSSVALLNFLIKMGHDVSVIVPNDYPDFLKWMKNDELIINYSNSKNESQEKIKNASLIFCLDFNNLNRINELGDYISDSKAKKVLIDHHLDPIDFYDFKIHDVKASATAELVYNFLIELDSNAVDKDISEALYTGILTDTGSFKFSMSPKVHKIVSDLMIRGVDIGFINNKIYDSNSLDKLKLIGYALSEKLEVISNGNAAYIVLSRKDLKDHNFKKGDTEGLVNYALSISNVNMAVLIIETKERIKFSFRSIGQFSVNEFAKKYFNGGGHKNAAGGSLEDKLSVALEKFLKDISKYSKDLNY